MLRVKLILLIVLFAFSFSTTKANTMPNDKQKNGTPANSDSLLASFPFQFTFKDEYKVEARYPASNFKNKRIDIYYYNVANFRDTVNLIFDNFALGKEFRFPITGRVSSGFGPRSLFSSRYHYGIDVTLDIGDTIYAAMDGVVRINRNDRYGYGNFIVVTHENGLETLYGHLSGFIAEPGTKVKAGDPIGLGGNTGRSTGPHLHFEFRFLGEPFDPAPILDFQNGKLLLSEIKMSNAWYAHKLNYSKGRFYMTQPGDTLDDIAAKNGVTIKKLCKLNNLKSENVVPPGVKLKVS